MLFLPWADNAWALLILVISTFCFLICKFFFFILVDMERIDSSTSQETIDEPISTTTKRTHDRLGCTLNSRARKNALYYCFVFFFLFSFDSFFLLVATKGWGLTQSTVSFPLHSSFIGYSSFQTFMSSPSVSNRTVVNLRNRTGEERRRQTLCDKRDNNFVWNNFSLNIAFL